MRLVPPGWRLGLLVLLASAAIAGGASAQQASTGGAPDLTGTWTVVNTSGPGVPGTLVITNGRGGAFDGTGYGGGWIVKGTVSGNSVHYTVSGQGSYVSTVVGTLNSDHTRITYSWTDTNGASGTAYLERQAAQASLFVELSAVVSGNAMKIGDSYVVRVTVSAAGSDFRDVSLGSSGLKVTGATYQFLPGGRKYTSDGRQVVVTDSPPLASGFPLADDTQRTFDFTVRATSGGPATLSATAHGDTDSGETVQATGTTRIEVARPPETMRRGGEPITTLSGPLRTSAWSVNPTTMAPDW